MVAFLQVKSLPLFLQTLSQLWLGSSTLTHSHRCLQIYRTATDWRLSVPLGTRWCRDLVHFGTYSASSFPIKTIHFLRVAGNVSGFHFRCGSSRLHCCLPGCRTVFACNRFRQLWSFSRRSLDIPDLRPKVSCVHRNGLRTSSCWCQRHQMESNGRSHDSITSQLCGWSLAKSPL